MEVYPRRGLIQSTATQTFYATISTGGYPCVIDVNVLCEFVNTSQRRDYQRSVYKHADLSQELEGQFTLTEKGVSVPVSETRDMNLEFHYNVVSYLFLETNYRDPGKTTIVLQSHDGPLFYIQFRRQIFES